MFYLAKSKEGDKSTKAKQAVKEAKKTAKDEDKKNEGAKNTNGGQDQEQAKKLNDIGKAIQKHIDGYGYSIVYQYCGHGLGTEFHSAPSIVHYATDKDDIELKSGMFFTVEPMINVGKPDAILDKSDGWTVRTRDMSLSAQFEHSMGVTEDGVEIFTLSPKLKKAEDEIIKLLESGKLKIAEKIDRGIYIFKICR